MALRIIEGVEIRPSPTHWLVDRLVPLGHVTLLEGLPGTAKSMLGYAIAGPVTAGLPAPFSTIARPPSHVLVAQAEDAQADTRARLEACGADMRNVTLLDPPEDLLSGMSILDLKSLMIAKRTSLILCDPLPKWTAYNLGAAAGATAAMKVLTELSRDMGAAILCIRHIVKGADSLNPLHGGAGSYQLSAGARSILRTAPGVNAGELMLLQIKNSLGPCAPPRAYRIAAVDDVPRIVWGTEYPNLTAEDVLGRPRVFGPRVREALRFLVLELSDGPVPASVVTNAAAAADVRGSLRRAYDLLQVRSFREGYGGAGQWLWELNDDNPIVAAVRAAELDALADRLTNAPGLPTSNGNDAGI